ncbi:MAG: hypothetical protein JNN03_24580 [Rubrivivax sp.]|nr:hypothetical protein [Rubrivivax sp.]
MALFSVFALMWVLIEEVIAARLQQPYVLAQVIWSRYAVHLLVLLALFGWRREAPLWRTGRPRFQVLRSMCMVVMPFSFIAALQQGTPANAVWALFWVAPLLVVLIARRWTSEPIEARSFSRGAWLCAGCALAAAVMLWPQLRPFGWPALGIWPLAAAAMALSFAIYLVMTRSLRAEAVQTNLFYNGLGPFLVLTPFMPGIWVMPTAHDALVLLAIGGAGLVGLWAIDRAAAAAPLTLTAPGLYAYLPLLAAVGWWVHGQRSTRREVLVVGLVAAALAHLWHLGSPGRVSRKPS